VTTRFRLDAVTLDTVEGRVHYPFPSDLTVLAGPTGVGKTTLLELVKFGFGGDGLLAPVVLQSVNDVTLDVSIGDSRLRLSRSIDERKRKNVRVVDLVTQERLPDHHLDTGQPNLNALLLNTLGFAEGMRAAARTGTSSNAGARITFNDIFTFLYVPQSEINRDIAHSQDSYRESKRKAVFELLFGLTDAEILAMRSRVNTLNAEVSKAEAERQAVLGFLRDSNTTGREEAEQAMAAAVAAEAEAEVARSALRETLDPVLDRETQTLRDLLTEAERGLADARATFGDITRHQTALTAERRRVQADLDRLHRMRDAGARLANIEFVVCPRCMQSLTTRDVPHGACRVCLQPDPATIDTGDNQYEARQLADQLDEMDDQLAAISDQLVLTSAAIQDRERLVKELTARLDTRTIDRITPRLQAFSDASDRLATARAQQQQLELVLRQWDRVNDLVAAEDQLRTDREQLKAAVARAEEVLDARRREILDSLNEEFQSAVNTLGIPGVEQASIHPTTYLPLLNGQPFVAFSRGGGIITATQVAYWTTLLTVALRRRDTAYPAFLLIDSPRLALNTAEGLSAALYRRMVTQSDIGRRRLQIIVADNELPAEYRREYAEIDFTYDHPTVSTVRHPGPAAVKTIGEPMQQGS
jgi:hypothetical protein